MAVAAVLAPWMWACAFGPWLQVNPKATLIPGWVENQPHGFLRVSPVVLLIIPCLHPWTVKRWPHNLAMIFISEVAQLWACSGCSPPAWCFRTLPGTESGTNPHSPLSSWTWISTSRLQFLSSFLLTVRFSPSLLLCSSILWLQWNAVQGSHGGETCKYLGFKRRSNSTAFRKPLNVSSW